MLQKEQGAEFPHGVINPYFERDFETRGCSLQQGSEAARLLGNSRLRPCSTGLRAEEKEDRAAAEQPVANQWANHLGKEPGTRNQCEWIKEARNKSSGSVQLKILLLYKYNWERN
ncbi:hypothetical protein Anapl_08807 [Anas platyrhynchos]|uniref:Uncharacterized protein n=1 Tax=Anas platyrhynchos TaxID=8839 RepID=R0KYS7_ANAPL|nr:hypothetical protein Anapl_08807 [Anas platyrhynchos]